MTAVTMAVMAIPLDRVMVPVQALVAAQTLRAIRARVTMAVVELTVVTAEAVVEAVVEATMANRAMHSVAEAS